MSKGKDMEFTEKEKEELMEALDSHCGNLMDSLQYVESFKGIEEDIEGLKKSLENRIESVRHLAGRFQAAQFNEEEKEMIFNSLGHYISILEGWHNEEAEGWNYQSIKDELSKRINMAREICHKLDPNNRYY